MHACIPCRTDTRTVAQVVLDKTGTLTTQYPSLERIEVNSEWVQRPSGLAESDDIPADKLSIVTDDFVDPNRDLLDALLTLVGAYMHDVLWACELAERCVLKATACA